MKKLSECGSAQRRGRAFRVALAAALWLAAGGRTAADVFNMGPGLTSLSFVSIGNGGNAADPLTGRGAASHAYEIGRHEVTAAQYTAFLNAVAATDTYALYNDNMTGHSEGCQIVRGGAPGSYVYSVATDYANRPVNFVSWGDAARFANWLTNGQPTGVQDLTTTENGLYELNGATSTIVLAAVSRKPGWGYALPTQDEWYKAAYHQQGSGTAGDYRLHATGFNSAPGIDLTESSNAGNNANYSPSGGGSNPVGAPYSRTEVGQFFLSASAYGTYDQTGNVWEWNEAAPTSATREIRGAAWVDGPGGPSGIASTAAVLAYDPAGHTSQFGFRVAVVPEPGSAILLVLGSIGMIAMRRRPQSAARRRWAATGAALLATTFGIPTGVRARVFVLPHVLESSGRITNTSFAFDTSFLMTYSAGLPESSAADTATVDLYIFDPLSAAPMESTTGIDVANPHSVVLDAGTTSRNVVVDDLITAAGGFGTGVIKLGFGILVVSGDADAVNVQGFVANSHGTPGDVSVFAFEPQPLSATEVGDAPSVNLLLPDLEESPGRTSDYGGCTDTLIKGVYTAGMVDGLPIATADVRLDFFNADGSPMQGATGPLAPYVFAFDGDHRVLSVTVDDLIEGAGGFLSGSVEGYLVANISGDWRNVTLASYVVKSDTGPNDVVQYDEHVPAPIPEPLSSGLLLMAGLGLAWRRRH